jgi:UDP-N-acetylmuramoyl-tripeptide--D-alanyl-D-alanine ligase
VAVLADMMELGPEEGRYHREVGEEVARLGIDLLVAVGERADGYVAGAGDTPSVRFATVEDAIAGLAGAIRPGDVVLLKGSRSMALERVGRALAEG